MKAKKISLSILGLSLLLGSLYVLPKIVLAGDMTIEEGSVFTDTFEKDGRRVEVSKTYTANGVVVHQKIYDSATGELIREKTVTNPIKDNVNLVSPSGSTVQLNTNTSNDEAAPTVTPTPEPETDQTDELTVLEDKVGPEAVAEKARLRYQLDRVDNVTVGQNENRSELTVQAIRNEKLLGLFKVQIPVEIVVDGESGDLIAEVKPFSVKLLDALSF